MVLAQALKFVLLFYEQLPYRYSALLVNTPSGRSEDGTMAPCLPWVCFHLLPMIPRFARESNAGFIICQLAELKVHSRYDVLQYQRVSARAAAESRTFDVSVCLLTIEGVCRCFPADGLIQPCCSCLGAYQRPFHRQSDVTKTLKQIWQTPTLPRGHRGRLEVVNPSA